MIRLVTAAIVVVCGLGGAATADDFPSRPIKIVVPFAAGGTADPMARGIAEVIRQKTNAVVVVEFEAWRRRQFGSARRHPCE